MIKYDAIIIFSDNFACEATDKYLRTLRVHMVKRTLKVGDAVARPGEWAKGKIPVFEYPDGTVVSLPVIILNGAQDGQILFLNASWHGPEMAGSEVIRRLVREEVKASELKGAIIGCLNANPLSTQHGHVYGNPRDDMHLQVPGSPDGSISQRIGHELWTQCCQQVIDNPEKGVVVDLHCNGISPPWAINIFSHDGTLASPETFDKAMKFAKAWGWTFHYHKPGKPPLPPPRPGDMRTLCTSKGVPGFGTEFTDGRRMTGAHVDSGTRGIKNGMKAIGMIPGQIEKQTGIKVVEGDFTSETMLYVNRGGYFYPKVHAGEWCPKGTVIAIIKDVYGDVVEEVKMEKDCYFYSLRPYYFGTTDTVGSGDLIAYRFNKQH